MGVWLEHHRQPCCKRIPMADRLQSLYSTAGASFLFVAGGALNRVVASELGLGGKVVSCHDPLWGRSGRPLAHVGAGGHMHRRDPRAQPWLRFVVGALLFSSEWVDGPVRGGAHQQPSRQLL